MKGSIKKLQTKLKTSLKLAQFSGQDSYGNCYYESRGLFNISPKKIKRWVIYKGLAEGSKVPPEWHGWLHYSVDHPPSKERASRSHMPNLTGEGVLKILRDSSSKKPYEPWTPD